MQNKWIALPLSIVLVFGMSATAFAAPNSNANMNATQKNIKAETVASSSFYDEDGYDMQAPGIAARILKYNDVKNHYGQGKTGGNFIADVAAEMGRNGQFLSVTNEAPDMAYVNAVLLFLNNHPNMEKELVLPIDIIEVGNVVAEDFGVMNQSNVLGYTVGFGLVDATAADVEDINIALYNGTTLLGIVDSDGVQENYPTATSLSAPFDVLGTFDYAADDNWNYSGWNADHIVVPTKAVITVTFENGLVKTAINENLTGDTSLVVVHTSNVVAEDFGVMNQSNVLGYTFGFGLVDATAADVEDISITLFHDTTPLGTVTSDGVQANYPAATSLSAPFDVLGTFDYAADGNWDYTGWNVSHTVVPTKAVITVIFENGLVKTATSEILTGDTTLITE